MINSTKWGARFLTTTAMGVCLATTPALAQNANRAPAEQTDGEAASVGEIIVTANRREERAQDVGISISAFSGDMLQSKNIRTAEDLAKTVPGLNSTASSGSSVSTVVIRGVGVSDFNDHQEQPNATYQDGVYIPFSTAVGIPVFDIERVEVLRGPQGTLFGRNATGGLIQYVANKPRAGTSAEIEVGAGERSLWRGQGSLNLGNDTIAARASLYYQTQDGYVKNLSGRNRGDKDVFAWRGQIKFTPDALTTINLRAEGYRQRGTNPGYIAYPAYYPGAEAAYLPETIDFWGTGPGKDLYGYRNPYKPSAQTVDLNNEGLLNKDSRTYALTIERKLGKATLTSITSYGKVNNAYVEDTDSTPFRQFEAGNVTSAHDFQQDLHISGGSDRLRYTVGGFYLDIKGNYGLYNLFDSYLAVAFGGAFSAPEQDHVIINNDYGVSTKSKAVYGQFEYDLSDKVTFIVGGRYTWDNVKLNSLTVNCLQTIDGLCDFFGGIPTTTLNTFVTGLGPVTINRSYSDWSGKAQINFKPSDDLLLYASASRGTKAAGYTAPLTGLYPIVDLPYRPERLNAFEIGEKAQILDRRLTINSSFYYYDYSDFQTFLFQNTSTKVLNRDAQAYGGELEVSGRFDGEWTANFGAAYSHFLVNDIITVRAPTGEKQRPINQPEWQLLWGLSKSVQLNDKLSVDLSYNGRYVGNAFYNIVNDPIVKAPGYVVHDATIRLESDKGWWVAGYINNIFDKTYQVGAFDVSFFSWSLRQFGEPRTVSVAAGIKF